jgi:methylenetetrahydrofolate reductase (NADPH)
MKVTQHLQEAKRTLFSIEILPPLKGENIQEIYATMDAIIAYEPSFIDVTYHREEYVFRDAGNGLLKKHTVRKRPGTVGICAALLNKYQIDTIPHIICGGFTKQETEDALIDLNFLGIDNVLVLRGDAAKGDNGFIPEPNGNNYAIDLLRQADRLNKGLYLEEDILDGFKTNFCLGVAGYPEKHFEATSLAEDLGHLKAKVDAGAEYIVTQMFFDNAKYFAFVKACREIVINQAVNS